jgi:hypothetical protein
MTSFPNKSLLLIAVMGVAMLTSVASWGLFIEATTEEVPVDRVIANLAREYDPASDRAYDVAWRLGRVNALAYAQGIETVSVDTRSQREFYGYEMAVLPPQAVKPRRGESHHRAKAYLDSAVVWYERAYEHNPTLVPILLGYGWALEQADRKNEARKMYRAVVDYEFKGPRPYNIPPNKTYAMEALDYLIPLLHPFWDWKELRLRKKQREEAKSFGTAISPIAIPLRAGLTLDDILEDDREVSFDLDGSGDDQCWTWITPVAGWLVCDFDGSGRITSGRKFFGNVTFWVFWNNGFEALKALDDDADGWLAGDELAGLKVWRDADMNGVCAAPELKSLEHYGVVALSTTYRERRFAGRMMWESSGGVKLDDGSTRTLYDVVLLPHRKPL